MKKIIALFFILSSFFGGAQTQETITINWIDKTQYSIGDANFTIPQFNPENFQFDGYNKQLIFNLKINSDAITNDAVLELLNVTYDNISLQELGDLSINEIPTRINATINSIQSRNSRSGLITFSPIIKEGNSFKKVKSVSYRIVGGVSKFNQTSNNFNGITNSVLATGEWYRFYIEKSGAYVINKSFLKQLGINPDAIDPRKIKLFGNGGRMIPLKNSEYYPSDLTENAIQVYGEEDGVFNDSDAIVFYGEGIDNWNDESQTSGNLYDNKSYYYINIQGEYGKRMPAITQPSGNPTLNINTFDDYQYYEVDKINIVKLGRRWFGEQFDYNDEQQFSFNIPNTVPNSNLKITIYSAASSFTSTYFEVKANNQSIGKMSFAPINDFVKATPATLTANYPATNNLTIKMNYFNNGVPDSKGYLDYIIVQSQRELKGYGNQYRFQYNAANSEIGIGEIQISNAQNISQVWDITDIFNAQKIENNNQSVFTFKASLGEVRKYIAIDNSNLYTPSTDSQTRIANQNIKGTIFNNSQGQFQDIDYIIITPSFLGAQAEKLADFHRNYSKLNVKVVYLENIYPEFSSGKQDIGAIRNLVKYVYRNASSDEKRIKYLNLFGDASYDYKNRISLKSNIVPIYHALNSFTLGESSFASDDFYGLMDENEGNVDTKQGGLDIAVGRMLASTNTGADELVNKVIQYYDTKSYNSWRNNLVIVADDSDKTSDASLQNRLNKMADKVVSEKPFINAKKILLDSYTQETSAGGSRYPKARQDMFNEFEKGALVFNYLGHGGEDGLAQERIWEKADGQNLNNKFKYPLFITITCQFSRFDNPFRPTAGEYVYWNPSGGAISMITTIREIGQGTGENFNDILAKYLFSYGSNQYTSIAEALRLAKNNFSSRTDVIFYLGDPALMLAIAKPQINLTEINDIPITSSVDVLKSLAYVKLEGNVTDEFKNPLPNYNGELSVEVFDKIIERSTLNNDGNSQPMKFNTLGETIFRGNATVTGGNFEFGFVVPRDIAIPVSNGRVSFYSKNTQELINQTGVDTSIKIGGINENAAVDNTPPKVSLYMNDQTFVYGGITNESPIFLAYLEDENGINTASGIGHDIVAILDGDESNPIKLNDYYETELDDYKKGKLKFPFRNLSVGLHTIQFKAWDVYNNLITAEIQFVVVGDETITLTNVLNYPNPFVDQTQFWFTHNKPYEPLETQVQVMSISGKIIWSKNQIITTDGFLSRDITWDGRDNFGNRIGKGVYIYKLTVKSTLTNTKAEIYEKLVIL
ncbi:MAG TPA: type IX secretion system sortase PorU [Flavobacterium sp.]|nr:type IX secretion system sortase PorU [Flavobacterium sp.]